MKKLKEVVIASSDDGQPLSKAANKERRKEENRQWMVKNRGGWGDEDPNPRHTMYYHSQLPDLVAEWDQLVETMRKELPSTFRVSETCNSFLTVLLQHAVELEYKRPRGQFIAVNGDVVQGAIVQPIAWCPRAYELSVDNATLSHEKGLERLSHFLQREVALGHLVRQELVSMIPASLVDIHHDHAVLDLCAAPGSKTEQLVGMMAASAARVGQRIGQGVLVGNDIDSKRILTLQQRLARCAAPQLVLTNGNAAIWSTYLSGSKEVFDRILCDVPCSGDGTFRKCPHLWRLFRPRMGLEFHEVQVSILMDAVRLLKPGGLLAYSTCSLNPLEDEAVIAAALRAYAGYVELVEYDGTRLPGLRYRAGLSSWQCSEDIFTIGETDKERAQSKARLPKLTSAMHPPSDEEVSAMALHKCMRIVPQDQNTGGFFIAVLRKTMPLPISEKEEVVKKVKVKASKAADSAANSLQVVKTAAAKPTQGGAVQAMKQLGYNPKDLANGKAADKFRILNSSHVDDQRILTSLLSQLPIDQLPDHLAVVYDTAQHTCSLMSHAAFDTMQTWGANVPVVQCGMSLGRGDGWAMAVDAHNAHALAKHAPLTRQVEIPMLSFQELLQAIASMQKGNGTAESDDENKTVRMSTSMLEDQPVCSLSSDVHSSSSLSAHASAVICATLEQLAAAPDMVVTLVASLSLPSAEESETSFEHPAGDANRKRRLSKAEQRKRSKQKVSASQTITIEETSSTDIVELREFDPQEVQEVFALQFIVGSSALLTLRSPADVIASQLELAQHYKRYCLHSAAAGKR